MVCPRCLLDVKGVLRDQTRLREVIQYQALHKLRRSPRLRPRKKNGKTLIKSHLQNRRKKLFNNFHLTFLLFGFAKSCSFPDVKEMRIWVEGREDQFCISCI